jgi:hypothetical protein
MKYNGGTGGLRETHQHQFSKSDFPPTDGSTLQIERYGRLRWVADSCAALGPTPRLTVWEYYTVLATVSLGIGCRCCNGRAVLMPCQQIEAGLGQPKSGLNEPLATHQLTVANRLVSQSRSSDNVSDMSVFPWIAKLSRRCPARERRFPAQAQVDHSFLVEHCRNHLDGIGAFSRLLEGRCSERRVPGWSLGRRLISLSNT